MRSFSYGGLKKYLATLGNFEEIKIIIVETPSRYYHIYLRQLKDLDNLPRQAIFNVAT
ncbi:hypothetical protein [Loigolactobacillus rennini]|nr:hypothetical protein [Loigolactobacillus rennini]SFZ88723.1 hypothetical protein LREN565_1836 [Loigolactobacillus rennini]